MSGIWIPTVHERKSIQERFFRDFRKRILRGGAFHDFRKIKKITLQGKQKDKDFYLSKNWKHDFQNNTLTINLPDKSGIQMSVS